MTLLLQEQMLALFPDYLSKCRVVGYYAYIDCWAIAEAIVENSHSRPKNNFGTWNFGARFGVAN